MSIKEKFENHYVIFGLSLLIVGFIAGFKVSPYFNNNEKEQKIEKPIVQSESSSQIINKLDTNQKKLVLKKIKNLISFGENIKKDHGMLISEIYITSEMKELRNNTLLLIENMGLKNSNLYKDIANEVEIGPQIEYQYHFALKLKYIDQYLGALKSLKSQIET